MSLAAPSGSVPGTGPPPLRNTEPSVGNPYLLRSVLQDLDHALTRAEDALGGETATEDVMQMVERWKIEMERVKADDMRSEETVRTGFGDAASAESGGMFSD